jgi:hypothetical protein
MKTSSILLAVSAVIVLGTAFYAFSQAFVDESPPPAADSLLVEKLITENSEPDELLMPLKADPKTGELMTWNGRVIDAEGINTPEKKEQRLAAAWAIENPEEYWKLNEPVYPPMDDATKEGFDMANPQFYTNQRRAQETREQRESREWAELAVLDPVAYQLEVEKKKGEPENLVDSQP